MTGIMSWLSAMIRVSEAAVTSRQFASIMSATFFRLTGEFPSTSKFRIYKFTPNPPTTPTAVSARIKWKPRFSMLVIWTSMYG